jgi:hypothetical protein
MAFGYLEMEAAHLFHCSNSWASTLAHSISHNISRNPDNGHTKSLREIRNEIKFPMVSQP